MQVGGDTQILISVKPVCGVTTSVCVFGEGGGCQEINVGNSQTGRHTQKSCGTYPARSRGLEKEDGER